MILIAIIHHASPIFPGQIIIQGTLYIKIILKIYGNVINGWRGQFLANLAKKYKFDLFTPINKLTKKQYDILMNGSNEKIKFNVSMKNGSSSWSGEEYWEGLVPQSERLYEQTQSEYRRKQLKKFMWIEECPICEGKRLKGKILSVKINHKSIADLYPISFL